jgi:hypothetical protein
MPDPSKRKAFPDKSQSIAPCHCPFIRYLYPLFDSLCVGVNLCVGVKKKAQEIGATGSIAFLVMIVCCSLFLQRWNNKAPRIDNSWRFAFRCLFPGKVVLKKWFSK